MTKKLATTIFSEQIPAVAVPVSTTKLSRIDDPLVVILRMIRDDDAKVVLAQML